MNTGLQDAANLSWKLAAAVRGTAPAGLLDTYHAERWPVGRTVLRTSGGMIRMALPQGPLPRAVTRLIGAAVRNVPAVRRKAAGLISGVGISYRGARRVPDVALAGTPGRLYEALRAREFVLIAPEGETYAHPGVRMAHWASDRRTLALVRPDGYLAFSTDAPDAARRTRALEAALTHWVG
ncbi:hypothetical protein BIV57_18065 [Mangrovactinospora gilvigrisea]|uniref:FAD-binding domain-containing protein n=2 Tax=Mangrovactinospora gilvigrisea TaxID=1428644 RepID=A0A1J7C8Z9_9ACTN|nr:hypothetical protein BIV57_18065 [Mangrovactinospora gilvigrisea]